MITCTLTPARALFRMMVPEWATAPVSGAGAAKKGGRLNRPDTEAVYLSFDRQTAMAEYQQERPFMPPGTLATFAANATVVDIEEYLTQPAGWSPIWKSWDCNWRKLLFDDHIDPPSWDLGDMVIVAGHNGIRFPSRHHPGGWNVVLYPESFGDENGLVCLDPEGLLKKVRRVQGSE